MFSINKLVGGAVAAAAAGRPGRAPLAAPVPVHVAVGRAGLAGADAAVHSDVLRRRVSTGILRVN